MNDSTSSSEVRRRSSKRSRSLAVGAAGKIENSFNPNSILDETILTGVSSDTGVSAPDRASLSAHPTELSFTNYSQVFIPEKNQSEILVEAFFLNLHQDDVSACALDAEIFPHWRLREAAAHEVFKLDASYKGSITRNMRNICVDWLIDINFEHGGSPNPSPSLLLPLGHSALNIEATSSSTSSSSFKRDKRICGEALSHAVFLLDRSLSAFASEGYFVLPKELQLLGASCLLTASQFEDITPLSIHEAVYYTASSVSAKDVGTMQKRLLKALDWRLSVPTQKHWLKPLLLVCFSSPQVNMDSIFSSNVSLLALFILDLGLLATTFATLKPSRQAASALFLARLVIENPMSTDMLHSDLICALSGHSFEDIKASAKIVHNDVVLRYGTSDKGRFKAAWKLHQGIARTFSAALGQLKIDW